MTKIYTREGAGDERERGGGECDGRWETSFLVCILITSFCLKLPGIRDTQPPPTLGLQRSSSSPSLRLHSEKRWCNPPSFFPTPIHHLPVVPHLASREKDGCRPEARKGWGTGRWRRRGGGIAFINLCRKKRIYFGRWPPIPDPVSIEAHCAKPGRGKVERGLPR